MVFSATSAAAAVGEGDPITTSSGRRVYALIGIVLLVVASAIRPTAGCAASRRRSC